MQRTLFFLAYFFVCTNSIAQQYPFVHYTPKDGLISNRVRGIYQDSQGRMYFLTMNGLSVYDGARFSNYTTEDGLGNDIVNCVMEMANDSVWVITNTGKINCLIKGKLKTLTTKNSPGPIINYLCRSPAGDLYAGADEGLFLFQQNSFVRLPLTDIHGNDINSYIASLVAIGNYLLCLRDPGLGGTYTLYLYDCEQKKIVSQTSNIPVMSIALADDGRLWVSTGIGISQLDKEALSKGRIILRKLPATFEKLVNKIGLVFFDRDDNCWVVEPNQSLIKCDKDGNIIQYTSSSGLSTININHVFQDKEGITWLASNGGGVYKLMHTNFSVIENPFGLSSPNDIFLSADKNDVFIYSYVDKKLARFTGNGMPEVLSVDGKEQIFQIVETSKGMYSIGAKKVFRLRKKNNAWYPELLFTDTSSNGFGIMAADPFGNILITGHHFLTAVAGETVFQTPVNYLADQIAFDNKGNVWLANRKEELVHYIIHPGSNTGYLQQKEEYKKELKGLAPRSIVLDHDGNIWIGTRFKGLLVFKEENKKITLLHQLTARNGLSENFVSYLFCDEDNAIWACTPSGLDRIRITNGIPVIENLTRQNNIYQSIHRVLTDKNKDTWALFNSGLIKITPEQHEASGFIPRLMFTHIRAGNDTLPSTEPTSFSYKQNNLSFYFASPSFMDEKQILYSYQLEGDGNARWSEPSNSAVAAFIDLPPGDYILNIKATFPAGRYPQQMLQYKFSILPPWWQTWWFRVPGGLFFIGMIILSIRFYYRRKLEKQKIVLEKQQAIEKERTRIATDMHDDLGAGLSRIKFLSETIGIKKQMQQPFDEDVNKIREYSHEMIDKMGEIVWALNEKNDSLSDLLSYTRSYAAEYLSQNGIRCTMTLPDMLPQVFVSGEFRRNIYLTIKEALHNIVKHAQASGVEVGIQTGRTLDISIHDNGTGFDKKNIRPFSNGLVNMEKRIKEIGGRFEILHTHGTLIRISIPIPG